MTPQRFAVRVDDFQGVARDVHPAKLPPALWQADEGGDLFERGTWRVRRGRQRLPLSPMAAPIETLFSFQTPAGSLALIVIDANGNFRGYPELTSDGGEVEPAVDLEGYGIAGEGEGGFGA